MDEETVCGCNKMNKLPKGARRDENSGAIVFKKTERGKHIDIRIIRKIILELYRVLPDESKKKMKPKVVFMLENL